MIVQACNAAARLSAARLSLQLAATLSTLDTVDTLPYRDPPHFPLKIGLNNARQLRRVAPRRRASAPKLPRDLQKRTIDLRTKMEGSPSVFVCNRVCRRPRPRGHIVPDLAGISYGVSYGISYDISYLTLLAFEAPASKPPLLKLRNRPLVARTSFGPPPVSPPMACSFRKYLARQFRRVVHRRHAPRIWCAAWGGSWRNMGQGAYKDARLVERAVGGEGLELTTLPAYMGPELGIQTMQCVSHLLQRLAQMFLR